MFCEEQSDTYRKTQLPLTTNEIGVKYFIRKNCKRESERQKTLNLNSKICL